ncbi:aspartyl-tRNA amidotransferase subunit B [Sporocytophaga myxococcoides]|uniref:Aspartyl-tRNA amidotransferase subunit B n=1 Tax=Sporocytophaga myxococcoides TaxID=153721 RepID=A0A098LM85_9BACT|nr:GatB/YqeY domain-containing protein [Sporocytophaga myxococcoides]GAL87609.1 aspartyl-tRNA amidotransferase subunit B [Sporocytophaga myxococcoides]
MSLKEKIDADIKSAMLAKNKDELRALRSIKSLILLAETDKGAQGEVSADAEIKLLTKAAKQRKESAEVYAGQGRADLEKIELDELAVIEKYLPKQLSEDEIAAKLKEIIAEVGAKGPGDMGKVMGAATKAFAGTADNKVVSALVKSLLSQ